jgi:hexosaminidase
MPTLSLASASPALIPLPLNNTPGTGPGCRISADTLLVAEWGTRPEAETLAAQLAPTFGRQPQVVDADPGTGAPVIALRRGTLSDASLTSEEAYELRVSATGVELLAPTACGVFRAAQTLLQLLPAVAIDGAELSALTITDSPRFPWRGAMLDPVRHFLPVDAVLRFIDQLARHKLNRLHLHLTDDQGWRVEIRRYPELTRVGAWRRETVSAHLGAKPLRFDGQPHGGFYSQEDIRSIVAYASARHIAVIPEIEIPGHAQSAIAAYPWLGNDGKPCDVFTQWGVNPRIYNAEERTIRFWEDVLSEVVELFPSPWIHIGGDEAVKDEWKASPRIQERIRELGVGDEHGLQSYLITRMDSFLTARGRRLLGWDEILEGGLSPNATVLSWRGFKGGIAAAKQGHDVIMASNTHTYFDYYQHPEVIAQPLAIGGMLPLEKVYAFEPVPPELSAEEGKHILGSQGQLWSEYITSPEHLEYMAFPRLTALAEVLWSSAKQRDWASFQQRLVTHRTRFAALGVNAFNEPTPGSIPARPRSEDRPALVVLAAGLGSRYGGDKQVAAVGPHDETILDFTAFDARRVGFAETVLVVRREHQELVHRMVGERIARVMPVRYVYQDTAEPFIGLKAPAARKKPWGTAHALACALAGLERPCGVVNADDWYSPAGVHALAQMLARGDSACALVTYPLGRTLSQNGSVNRAICETDKRGFLSAITETTGIISHDGSPAVTGSDGSLRQLAPDTPVSLNLWGFQPNAYAPLIADVEAWIRAHLDTEKEECFLPTIAMAGCTTHGWGVRCNAVDADWTGLTHPADRDGVCARLAKATTDGEYPSPLWS